MSSMTLTIPPVITRDCNINALLIVGRYKTNHIYSKVCFTYRIECNTCSTSFQMKRNHD